MLANIYKRLVYGVVGATLCWCADAESLAQQPPSTRYQPVEYNLGDEPLRQAEAPPSVHIPPPNAQNLPAYQGHRISNDRRSALQAGNGKVFSDAGSVRQSSYQDPANLQPEPSVPEILKRTRPVAASTAVTPTVTPTVPTTVPTTIGRPPVGNSSSQLMGLGTPPSPAKFASQLSQLRQAPSVDQKKDDRLAQMKKDFEALQRKDADRIRNASLKADAAAAPAPTSQSSGTEFSSTIPKADKTGATGVDAGSQSRSPVVRPAQEQFLPLNSKSKPAPAPSRATEPAQAQTVPGAESVSDFLKPANRPLNSSTANANSSPPSKINDSKVRPASMQAEDGLQSTTEMDSSSPAGTVEQNRPNSAIRLSAPSIAVESFGPQSIGINKPAIYKVVASNETSNAAERVVVSIDLPNWVEIDKVNMTAGEQQMTQNKQHSRLMWKIEQIPGNGSQTLTITAIPRKAEAFDLGIEWTIAPRAGTANIQVTQPKLEMTIVGPEEVQFGETVPYEVTVRNAGNGVAENVAVILSESLGGERGNLEDIPAGSSKSFTVSLVARTPGELELGVSAVADNQAESSASRKLVIRRANLGISIAGPNLRYAGTTGEYLIKLTNTGDATAEDVVAAMGLPSGVKFLGGIEAFKLIDGGLRWQIGRLEAGQVREYKATCQLDTSGEIQLEVGIQGKGALQASHACVTKVQTIADLVMQVNDPPGPLTTGAEITYEILIENRGTKTAKEVDIFMILSEGMEPRSGSGLEYRIPRDGALQFATIPQIDPGQKLTLKVNAVAYKPGTHVFRAHLVCEEADAREIKEGTSRFFGDEVANPTGNTADGNSSFNNDSDFKKNLK